MRAFSAMLFSGVLSFSLSSSGQFYLSNLRGLRIYVMFTHRDHNVKYAGRER